ncbi:hypothetical protein D3C71_1625290 [compost metagenome]
MQLVELERLDDVVVGARIQALNPFAQPVARGKDEHRRGVVARAQLLQDRQPASVGQPQVQQHGVKAMLHQGQSRLGNTADPMHVNARLRQAGVQGIAQHGVVFY